MNPLQDAFISYGRADSKQFAQELSKRLKKLGYTVWFDFNDIPLGVDYQKQIDDGIEKADNFLYLISPHSVNSAYCGLEVELALKRHKRIIPLLHVEEISYETWRQRNPEGTEAEWEEYKAAGKHSHFTNMHPEIRKINWVYFREGIDDFGESFEGLLALLEREKDYVHQHTVLLNDALEWERNQKQTRYLLTGEERQNAEEWLAIRFKESQPPVTPTDLHYEYITETIKNGDNLMTQVFLSHAEEDTEITDQVRRTLMRSGITTWTHRTDIEYGSDFEASLQRGVEEADNVLFLMSRSSLDSKYCQQEIDLAIQLNKRLIIMLAGAVDETDIPVALRNLQYIDLTDNETEADYLKDEDDLLRVLKQDASYFNEHKVLLTKALKWERQQRNPCILLQGYELQHAQAWREVAQARDTNGPIDIQTEFIEASKNQTAAVSPDVFISYSRADSDFARKLNNALQRQRKRTWFDQESIASGVDFQQEIDQGIESSNFFLFVLSPRSVKSPYCADEVEYAAKLNKRMVTVLHRPVEAQDLHPELAKVQWIDFNANEGEFEANFKELLRTLDTDPVHLRYHTGLLMKAIEWDEKGRREDVLLRGDELAEAQQWMVQAAEKEPSPTVLQGEYMTASQKLLEATQKAKVKQQRNAVRRLRSFLAASLLLTCFATLKTHQAARQRMRAYEATAEGIADTDPLNSLVHGLAAINLGQSRFVRFPQWNETSLIASTLLDKANRNRRFEVVTSHGRGNWQEITGQVSKALFPNRFPQDLLPLPENTATSVAFSSNGQTFVSGGWDGRVRLWNKQGKPINLPLKSHKGRVSSVAFSPDGQTVISAGGDGTIRRWDKQGNPIGKPIESNQGFLWVVAFSPDGQTFVSTGGDGTIRRWDKQGNPIEKPIESNQSIIWAISFHPDGKIFASTGEDGTVRLWDSKGNPVGKPMAGHQGRRVLDVAFSPDGKKLVSTGEDGLIRQWDSQGNPIGNPIESDQGFASSIAFSPNGQTLISGGWDATVKRWDSQGKSIGSPLEGHQGVVLDVAFSLDGQTLISTGEDGTVRQWNRYDNSITSTLEGHQGAVHSVTFSADGQTLISGSADSTVRRWDNLGNAIGEPLSSYQPEILSVVSSPDGRTLISVGLNGKIWMWDGQGNRINSPLENYEFPVSSIAFSPDNQTIVSGGEYGEIRWWDSQGKRIVRDGQDKFIGYHSWMHLGDVRFLTFSPVRFLTFSPDGQTLASAGEDGKIRLWSIQGEPIGSPLEGHEGEVHSVAFDADGQILASAGEDGTIRLWNNQGEPIGSPLEGHEGEVHSVAFSPSGKTLASAGEDGNIQLWPIQLAKEGGWVGYTCRHLQGYLSVRKKTDDVAREAWHACRRSGVWKSDRGKEQ